MTISCYAGEKVPLLFNVKYFVSLTALSGLEELNLDRTSITDEGCSVLERKSHLRSHFIHQSLFLKEPSLIRYYCSHGGYTWLHFQALI